MKTLYDPACGTGGMLSVAEDYLRELNPDARLEVFGQELNEETYAICRSDMMLKGQDASHIVHGNSFDEDGHARPHVRLHARQPAVRRGVEDGRASSSRTSARSSASAAASAPGCRAINDGSFLFLQHMISKMKPADGGRLAARDRLQRLAALHRRRRLGRVGDPPLDHRERLARGGRRAPRPALLQHRHLDLLLGRHEPQEPGAARQGAARRRARARG